ncbi:MAG: MlaD family protein [Cyanobacteria bacterium]|nr:MlaD family protein [Cyanobacteriota bacterium]
MPRSIETLMKRRSATVKVGLLALVSVLLLVFVMIWLRGRGLTTGDTYTVFFQDVDGMREGAAVQIMGIRIGFIDTIQPTRKDGKYYVAVKFTINTPEIKVPKGSQLSIQQSGIIGEKFLEITPPQLREILLTTFKMPTQTIKAGIPVKFLYQEGLVDVGRVERVETFRDDNLIRHKLSYRITRPGSELPVDPIFELALSNQQQYYLRILPRKVEDVLRLPDKNLAFTIENPLRIKKFLEIQLESAEALRLTNDKINELLSDETIATLNGTLKNTEILTARATEVLDSANQLFKGAGHDLEQLVKTSDGLSKNLIQISQNVNGLIGDPNLKKDLLETATSVQQSTKALAEIMRDPALKETIALSRDTAKNSSELVSMLKHTAEDKQLQSRLDNSVTQLNGSLTKLSKVLDHVEQLSADDGKDLKGIVKDTRETTENLKQFSKKLNGRFTLFRLLF